MSGARASARFTDAHTADHTFASTTPCGSGVNAALHHGLLSRRTSCCGKGISIFCVRNFSTTACRISACAGPKSATDVHGQMATLMELLASVVTPMTGAGLFNTRGFVDRISLTEASTAGRLLL